MTPSASSSSPVAPALQEQGQHNPPTVAPPPCTAPATELLICTTCRPTGASREPPAAGQVLWEAVQAALQAGAPARGVLVRGVACLSVCSRACTVALQAAGKHTYCFGDLPPGPSTARQLLACAAQHAASADGNLPRSERPEALRGGILLRLPPLAPAEAPAPAPAAALVAAPAPEPASAAASASVSAATPVPPHAPSTSSAVSPAALRR